MPQLRKTRFITKKFMQQSSYGVFWRAFVKWSLRSIILQIFFINNFTFIIKIQFFKFIDNLLIYEENNYLYILLKIFILLVLVWHFYYFQTISFGNRTQLETRETRNDNIHMMYIHAWFISPWSWKKARLAAFLSFIFVV